MTQESPARIGFGAAVGIAVVAVLSVAVWQWLPRTPKVAAATATPEPEPEPRAEVAEPVARPPAIDAETPKIRAKCLFKPGETFGVAVRERRRWTVDLAQDATTPLPAAVGGVAINLREAGDIALAWRLDMRCVSAEAAGGAVFVATVSRPQRSGDDGVTAVGPDRMTVPFLMRIGPRCDVQSFGRSAQHDPTAAHATHALISGLHWRLPSPEGSRNYSEHERDGHGVHQYSYRVVGRQTPRLVRRPTGCTELYMFDGRGSSATLNARGPTAIVPGDRGWFALLERSETRTMRDGGAYASLRWTLTAKPVRAEPIGQPVADTVKGWIWGDLLAVRASQLETQEDGAIVGLAGMPVATLRRTLHQLRTDQALDPLGAIDLARDWPRANPEKLTELVTALRGSSGDDPLIGTLLLGLRLTNDPEALRILMGLIADVSQPLEVRAKALFACAGSPLLSGADVDAIRGYAVSGALVGSVEGRLARAAITTLGQIAWLQRHRQADIAEIAQAAVKNLFGLVRDAPRKLAVLKALGNAGDDTLVELLADQHQSEDPEVRAAAALATAKMHPATGQGLLEDWIGTESDPTVQTAIGDAVATQVLLYGDDLRALTAIRGPAVMLLGRALGQSRPWAREALQRRLDAEKASDEPNPSITGEIDAFLARYPE